MRRKFLLWFLDGYRIVEEGSPECSIEQADLLERSGIWREIPSREARRRRYVKEIVHCRRSGQHYRRERASAAG